MAPVHQHRPAGNTDRPAERTRAIITVEAKALPCQAVEVGGINVGVTMRGNGVCALVIGKQENDVRQLVRICMEAGGYNQGNDRGRLVS